MQEWERDLQELIGYGCLAYSWIPIQNDQRPVHRIYQIRFGVVGGSSEGELDQFVGAVRCLKSVMGDG